MTLKPRLVSRKLRKYVLHIAIYVYYSPVQTFGAYRGMEISLRNQWKLPESRIQDNAEQRISGQKWDRNSNKWAPKHWLKPQASPSWMRQQWSVVQYSHSDTDQWVIETVPAGVYSPRTAPVFLSLSHLRPPVGRENMVRKGGHDRLNDTTTWERNIIDLLETVNIRDEEQHRVGLWTVHNLY